MVEKAKDEGILYDAPDRFEMVAGRGVRAEAAGKTILAGNAAFLREQGVSGVDSDAVRKAVERLAAAGKTPLLFARCGTVSGVIAVADTIRETSRAAIRQFQAMGLQVVMLTGEMCIRDRASSTAFRPGRSSPKKRRSSCSKRMTSGNAISRPQVRTCARLSV